MTDQGWERTTWGAVSDLRYGKSLSGYRDGGGCVRVFGTNGPVGWTKQPLAHGPRPVVGRKGAYRGVHLADGPFWVIDTAYWLEPGPEVDPVWAYYALLQLDINAMDSGSAIPSLSRNHLLASPLRLPHLHEQRAVVAVLSRLDELMEANRRVASDCESLAVTLAWRDVSELAQLRQLADPVLDTEDPLGLVDHFSLPAFDAAAMPERVEGSSVKSRKLLLREPSVLVSRLNPHIPRVWMAYPEGDINALASTEFVALTGRECPPEFIWAACAGSAFISQLQSRVTGTTGSHQRVDKSAIMTMTIPDARSVPSESVDAIVFLVRQAHQARVEAAQLARTRDELLPLLMSGHVVPGEVAV